MTPINVERNFIMSQTIPYKIYLEESEMPKQWYNVRADMKNKPAPLLNPATLEPMTAEELSVVFCDELVKQAADYRHKISVAGSVIEPVNEQVAQYEEHLMSIVRKFEEVL